MGPVFPQKQFGSQSHIISPVYYHQGGGGGGGRDSNQHKREWSQSRSKTDVCISVLSQTIIPTVGNLPP